MSDTGLSVWELMAVDPAVPMDPAALRLVIRDQRRSSRAYVYPWLRVVSRVLVTMIVGRQAALPGVVRRPRSDGPACLWFLRRFVSEDAVSLLIRHFIVETNLLNFCLRNALPGVPEVGLRPVTLAGLGDRAVIEHDLNVYRCCPVSACPEGPGRATASTTACSTFRRWIRKAGGAAC